MIYDSWNIVENIEVFAEDAIMEESPNEKYDSVIGWISIDGTQINQPIVQGDDNDYYLRHDYRGNYSIAGSVFLDYRNAKDWSDDFAIIYGHRMTGHLMFGDIKLFADETFFTEHQKGKIKTGAKIHDFNILGYIVIDAADELYELRAFRNDENDMILEKLKLRSANWRDDYMNGRVVMLSTCDANSKKYRNVLIGEIID